MNVPEEPGTQPGTQPGTGWQAEIWRKCIQFASDFRLLLGLFAAVAAAIFAGYKHFATAEEFARLDCNTRVNMRMLEANFTVMDSERNIEQARTERGLYNAVLAQGGSGWRPTSETISLIKEQIVRLEDIERTNLFNKDKALAKSQLALTRLNSAACNSAAQRVQILHQIDDSPPLPCLP